MYHFIRKYELLDIYLLVLHCSPWGLWNWYVSIPTFCNYRPQRSCGQGYVFTCVCDSVNRGDLRAGPPWQGEPPLDQVDTPQDQAGRPSQTRQTPHPPPPPSRENAPRTRQEDPLDQADPLPRAGRTPPTGTRQTPPAGRTPPGPGRPPQTSQTPPEQDCSIQSMTGRYASYWNAFLF